MFTTFSKAVENRFAEMSTGELFVVEVDDIFAQYLSSFPKGSDPIFRTRTEHDCQCCKQFVKILVKLYQLKIQKLIVYGSNLELPSPYKEVAERMNNIICNSKYYQFFELKKRNMVLLIIMIRRQMLDMTIFIV
jgi:hypothetical protein